MVVFDATVLMLLLRPESGKPIDPATGQPVADVQERIAHFVAQNDRSRTKIGIPTPALSEVLVRSGAAPARMVDKIKEYAAFEILPFDEISAIEVAMMTRDAIDGGDKKSGSSDAWGKVKYDRQIAAIARVRRASAIYTDDRGLSNLCARIGIQAIGAADLPLPLDTAQGELGFAGQTSGSTFEGVEAAQNDEATGGSST